MIGPIRILVVDDHPIFRRGLLLSLSERGDFIVCGEAEDADGAVIGTVEHQPDLVLLDLSIPGGGREALVRILSLHPQQKVLILTASEDDDDLIVALGAGAAGYALKGLGVDALFETIHAVMRGEIYAPPGLAGRIVAGLAANAPSREVDASGLDDLTDREVAILRHLSEGACNKTIARAISLEEKTVKNHMTRIMAKLNVRNRVEAALFFQAQRGTKVPGNQQRSR
ncbi:MAG: LuxR C-terminal-related transcriptional regulator [Brevundimonas sp.]|jgi:two-component system nitrate/nitrite response regulator NarL|uniref:LuxR C-terminal-related transcriptional regulator n=1 Tax=Brevundimonas sp. TaxID=1871086 RepID=UPI00391CDA82